MTKEQKIILEGLVLAGIRFVIGGSYGMRHIRPPHDLDLLIHNADWEALKRAIGGMCKPVEGAHGESLDLGDSVEAFKESWPTGFAYADLMGGYTQDENGFWCWSLDQTRKWKRAFRRPKDVQDLRLIEDHLIENWEREQAEMLVNTQEYADWDF
jgi:hypothetical protein